MRFGIESATIAALTLAGPASASKGSANVNACVWHPSPPIKSYTVSWRTGSADDRCMRLVGSSPSMVVKDQGLTCTSLGEVAVDSSWSGWTGGCYTRNSIWGLSYTTTGAPYSGSTSSDWNTGPFNTDMKLISQSPGTSVCGGAAHCSGSQVEWDNDKTPQVYVVFQPGKVGNGGKSEL
ncbi:putative Ig-like domain-containing protein [Seiridium unicorne]|uniref:Ig-like domain-containing protein n=1 Tax=Seiridium unicorne TaxID=138068 RepID=A0ABR2UZ19_9PEZI